MVQQKLILFDVKLVIMKHLIIIDDEERP